MVHYTCDMCGKALLLDEDVRYVVKIEVYAAYDPMEVTEEEIDEDHTEELNQLCESLENADEREVEEQVYKTFRFDLCAGCHERYLKDPLGLLAKKRVRYSDN